MSKTEVLFITVSHLNYGPAPVPGPGVGKQYTIPDETFFFISRTFPFLHFQLCKTFIAGTETIHLFFSVRLLFQGKIMIFVFLRSSAKHMLRFISSQVVIRYSNYGE